MLEIFTHIEKTPLRERGILGNILSLVYITPYISIIAPLFYKDRFIQQITYEFEITHNGDIYAGINVNKKNRTRLHINRSEISEIIITGKYSFIYNMIYFKSCRGEDFDINLPLNNLHEVKKMKNILNTAHLEYQNKIPNSVYFVLLSIPFTVILIGFISFIMNFL